MDGHWPLHFRDFIMGNLSPFRVKYNFHFLISNVLPQNPLVKTKVQKTKYWGIYKDEKFKTCHDYWKHPHHVFFSSFPSFSLHFYRPWCFQISKELDELHAKNWILWMKIAREIIFQSWLLKNANFHYFPTVQWPVNKMYWVCWFTR